MNIAYLLLLACPLLAAPPRTPAGSAPRARVMPGSYQSVDPDSAEVREARAAIQRQMECLPIASVQEAFVQVVAGLNYKLVCRVETDGNVWEFVVWHRLNDAWELTSAKRLSVR